MRFTLAIAAGLIFAGTTVVPASADAPEGRTGGSRRPSPRPIPTRSAAATT
ncbi:hypothetical protein ACFQX6_49260 [Streptosporangium lutulentum]